MNEWVQYGISINYGASGISIYASILTSQGEKEASVTMSTATLSYSSAFLYLCSGFDGIADPIGCEVQFLKVYYGGVSSSGDLVDISRIISCFGNVYLV